MGTLDVASRALTTNLAALQVIGHNIANVNTEGYTRQTIELASSGAQRLGNGYFGKGVEIAAVDRAYDAYLSREAQITQSVAAGDEVRFAKLTQMESLFPMGESGLGAALNDALNAWVDVSSSPTDLTARTVVLTRAEELASRLRDTVGRLDELRLSATLQVESTVESINTLAQQIAALNKRIVAAQGSSATPNDLLDQREQLLRDLNQYIQTSNITADDGSVTVFVASSQPLVLGATANRLNVEDDPLDSTRKSISITQGSGTFGLNADFLGGGELGGLLSYVNEDVPDALNSLGRLALSLATQMNAQHRLGLDLNGVPGGDFFNIDALPDGVADPDNAGTATLSLSVSDATAFMASEYAVLFSGATSGTITRLSDGQVTAFSAVPITLDGLNIDISAGAAQLGDRFLLQPFSTMARNIEVALSAPQSLAAASPVLVAPTLQDGSGIGLESAYLTGGTIPASPGSLPDLTVTYSAATGQFSVTSLSAGAWVSAPQTYTPGEPLSFDIDLGAGNVVSYELRLRGAPVDGDALDLSQGTGAEMRQNSGNAAAILALRDVASFEGVSLGDGYISVFSDVASKVQTARFAAEFSATAASEAERARSNVSGVNLDEEAARLIQYQQSYQAAAKFLQVAQGTFDTLLQAFGR